MTFAPAKFEVAMSNSLGEDAFTRKYIFDLDLQVKITLNVAQCPLHHVTYAPTEFEVTRRSIFKKIQYLTFDLGVKVTQNVAQYPLHHVTYPATKFEVARSNRLRGDTFTRKNII